MKPKKRTVAKKKAKPPVQVVVPDGIDPFLTPTQVMVSLGYVNKQKVFNLIHEGSLKAVNIKKPKEKKNQWRVRASELKRFMAKY